MRLVLVAQALHDAHGLLLVGLVDGERLEAALQGRVLLQVLAELLKSGGADDLNLAAGQRGLQNGGRIDGALGRASADDGVDLVDEQQHVAGIHDLLDDLLQALLELAAVLGTGHERRHVQRDEALAAQDVGHLVAHDELGQPLGDGRLAHAGLAQDEGVVLLATGQDLHDALDFRGAADDRVQLAVAGLLREIGAELGEHGIRRGRPVEAGAARVDRRLAHEIVQGAAHIIAGHVQATEYFQSRALALAHDAQEQVLGGDVGLAHLHGLAQGVLQHALHPRREGQMPRHVGVLVDGDHLADGLHHPIVGDVQAIEGLGGQAVLLLDKAQEDMLGAHVGLMERTRLILSQDQHLAGFVREFLE